MVKNRSDADGDKELDTHIDPEEEEDVPQDLIWKPVHT